MGLPYPPDGPVRNSPSAGRRRTLHWRDAAPVPSLAEILDEAAGHYAAGRLEAAAALYRQVETFDPDDIRARYSLAVIDLRGGRFEDARRRLKAVLRRHPEQISAHHNLGVAEQALGAWAAAAAAYDRALALDAGAAHSRVGLAVALAVLGRTEEAIAHYRILAADPAQRPRALTRLAVLRAEAISDTELADLRRGAGDAAVDADTRIGLLFALGSVLEARGDGQSAFDAFAAGNALKHRVLSQGHPATRPSSVAREHAQSIARIRSLFTAEFIAAHEGQGDQAIQPIFIVGMPRSGSSLIEQILASHAQVHGMGESGALWSAVDGRFPYPPDLPRQPGHFRVLARLYLDALRRRGWPERTRPTDKTLDNHLHLGLIHLMFPRAVILHAVRDRVDTGLACYRQLFASGAETLYDLADIAAEQRRYQSMMDHWGSVLPGRVIEVRYEDLTTDPEAEIRRLVTQACGLRWSSECLRFHQTPRAIATASASQARQPIFRSSVGRWRLYQDRLGPLIEGLQR